MSEPVIPSRYRLRVKQRLVVISYAEDHGVKPAGRHFGLSHKTVRRWRDRHRADGVLGLLPRYPKRRRRRVAPEVIPLVQQARTEHRFGAARTRIWLQRVHGISVATQTIQRLFHDLGLHRLPSRRKRRPKQLRLFAKDQPGDSVQVDVKFVRVNRQRYFFPVHPLWTTARDSACCACIGSSITEPAWRSSVSSARPCHFRFANCSRTMAPNSRSTSRSRCRPPGSSTATSRRVDQSRTVRWSAAIE